MNNSSLFSPPGRKGSGSKIGSDKKEMVFSGLNSLLSSGLDFSRSFSLLIEDEPDTKMRAVLQSLYDYVVSGTLLWQAVEKTRSFSPLDQGVIRIGEETGQLSESLRFLGNYYKKRTEQSRMITSALRYPLIVLGIAVVVVIFMMAVIVPMFEQVYTRMGGELPAMTRWIISVSKSFPVWGTAAGLAAGGLGIAMYAWRNTRAFRETTSSLILKAPLAGGIVRKNQQAHFCKLLHLLTQARVPLLHGVEMLGTVISFYPYQRSFGSICEGLRRGELLSENLAKYPHLYDRKLATLIRVGEETNSLPTMFLRQSDELTKELELRIQKLGSVLEPFLVFVVGGLVAVILISMYMPMFKLGGIMS